jgi:hypothetical protein
LLAIDLRLRLDLGRGRQTLGIECGRAEGEAEMTAPPMNESEIFAAAERRASKYAAMPPVSAGTGAAIGFFAACIAGIFLVQGQGVSVWILTAVFTVVPFVWISAIEHKHNNAVQREIARIKDEIAHYGSIDPGT